MEIAALAVILIVLVLAAAWIRASAIIRRNAEAERDAASDALETTRRITDATRNPLPPDDARHWLRRFRDQPPGGR